MERKDRGLGAAAAAAAKRREVEEQLNAYKGSKYENGHAKSSLTLEERRTLRAEKKKLKASKVEVEEALAAKAYVRAYGEKLIAHRIAGVDMLVEEKQNEEREFNEESDQDDEVEFNSSSDSQESDEGNICDDDDDDGEYGTYESGDDEEVEDDDEDESDAEEDQDGDEKVDCIANSESEEDELQVAPAKVSVKQSPNSSSLRSLKAMLAASSAPHVAGGSADKSEFNGNDDEDASIPYEAKHLLDQSHNHRC